MVTHSDQPEDMNEMERRLSAWQPNCDGLDADAVLFAAGRASKRPGPARFVWPGVTTLLAALVVVLGMWLSAERNERMALVRQLRQRPPASVVNATPHLPISAAPVESPDPDEPAPDSYLASRRALEKGLDAWPSRVVVRSGPTDPPLTSPPILTPGQRDTLLEP